MLSNRDVTLHTDSVRRLPVLVMLHGESYEWNSGNGALDGTMLAAAGQLIVVTLNYRLGIFGKFLDLLL